MLKFERVVLPQYTLDSNLVFIPGIIYNVTFLRFKAAALLNRFRSQLPDVALVSSLLQEFDFSQAHDNQEDPKISSEASNGILSIYRREHNLKSGKINLNDFDWLTLAIRPNESKIVYPKEAPIRDINVAVIVRVIGIADDTTNIRLTFQAITRGFIVNNTPTVKHNEIMVDVQFDTEIADPTGQFNIIRKSVYNLFKVIDMFVINYRKVTGSSSPKGALVIKKTPQNEQPSEKPPGDLITLNPVANALYIQLVGNKDFAKAFTLLQKLYGQYSLDNQNYVVDSKSLLRLIDLTAGVCPFPNYEKLSFLNIEKPKKRVDELVLMVKRLEKVFLSIDSNNSYLNQWFNHEALNIQKATVVANQLKLIRLVLEGMTNNKNSQTTLATRNQGKSPSSGGGSAGSLVDEDDLDEDDDELKQITQFVKTQLPKIQLLSPELKRLIVKDYKRIKLNGNQPGGGNLDFHVIRNYLEIVADLPWDRYVTKFKLNKDIDLLVAKQQLDDDHYGLEHVKKRLIQYLVVLKLLAINAEKAPSTKPVSSASREEENDAFVIANLDESIGARKQAQSVIENSSKQVGDDKESIEVSKLNKSPIIMLAGPPGTGKTSLAKLIAQTLGRNFQRISLGGVKDESEIRGHRRTYVGAMPGLIIQALRKARLMNPVILLDEIDKVVGGNNSPASKYNGDPLAALLEVLDPEQNTLFIDHYLGFPVDLSQVIFVCTANEPYQMSRPLLDRLEMIDIGAYDYLEKLVIGRKYLLPRQLRRNGFPLDNNDDVEKFVSISDDAMKQVIIDYTREAGVRNFERRLGTICRYKAVEYCEALGLDGIISGYEPTVTVTDLPKYLGVPYSSGNLSAEVTTSTATRVGIVNGLSYNSEGLGLVLVFELIGIDKRISNPDVKNTGCSLSMTGRLGEVLMESGKIGLIFIKLLIYKGLLLSDIGSQRDLIEKINNLEINLHVPMGLIQKDGPLAGVTMALLFLSLIMDKPVPADIAMTGEITLRGLVLPIGGVKEKLLGAHLTGQIRRMIIPRENRKDLIEEYLRDMEEEGKSQSLAEMNALLKDNEEPHFTMTEVEEFYCNKYGIQMHYAKEFLDIMKLVWPDDEVVKAGERMIEYHL